jgi:molybdate transport system substrate-binding protein
MAETSKPPRSLIVMSALAVKLALERSIVPALEADAGLRLDIAWQPTSVLMKRIAGGERADVIIAIDESMDALERDGIIESRTRVKTARALLGVAVRRGDAHPDISTVAAFRDALLAANGVAYSIGGASGIYFGGLLSKLGIARSIKSVTIPAGFTAEKLITGEADLAIQQISELITVPGAEIVGPFPDDVQSPTDFSAAVFKGTANPDGARTFLQALVSGEAHRAYEAAGLVSRLTERS